MQRERLQLALERLESHHWKLFEEFSSAFLSTQYPNLRTVASPSGDQGRDAELFEYDSPVETVLQYSVAADWAAKIKKSAKRISESRPETKMLIYVTNQSIVSRADDLKSEVLSDYGLFLDVHDREWFLDRFLGDAHRETVCETLAQRIVDPYLSSQGVLAHSAPTLSSTEYRAALTFLQLQWEDDTREKGLTRLSFEALVRTSLRSTDSSSKLSRAQIHDSIIAMFPAHDPEHVRRLVDTALARLTKRYIRHWMKDDEFCLTYEESLRVRERLAKIELANSALDSEIQVVLKTYVDDDVEVDGLVELTRATINHYLFQRGEAFASTITNNQTYEPGVEDLRRSVDHLVDECFAGYPAEQKAIIGDVVFDSTRHFLMSPTPGVQSHLRSKADAYTLFAFLGQTPDVQAAVSKMFSHGTIWIDTTIVLPLFAEQLIVNGQRRFSQMLETATSVGLNLRVTPGVIEEVERHVNRCSTYLSVSHAKWTGNVPFLIEAYSLTGRGLGSFNGWIENFMGQERPEDDIAEYLITKFGIERESLEEDERAADLELRTAVQEAWIAAHTRRREGDRVGLDDITVNRLARHDVENYVGVIERRRRDAVSPLGYSAWWLTLDGSVNQVRRDIGERLGYDTPPSPVMSADFLVNYLSIGPIRAKVSKQIESGLPIGLDIDTFEGVPADLLIEAERIRLESGDLEEHIVRRRVRDHLDSARRRRGRVSQEGIQTVLASIKSMNVSE